MTTQTRIGTIKSHPAVRTAYYCSGSSTSRCVTSHIFIINFCFCCRRPSGFTWSLQLGHFIIDSIGCTNSLSLLLVVADTSRTFRITNILAPLILTKFRFGFLHTTFGASSFSFIGRPISFAGMPSWILKYCPQRFFRVVSTASP